MSDETTTLARQVRYSPEVAQRVADAYANGKSLRAIGATDGMPDYVTIWRWKHEHPEFATILAHARAAKAETLASDGLEIVDNCDGDSSSQVGKAREQGAYRRWLAGCLDRATYGDSVQLDVKAAIVLRAFTDAAPQVAATVVDTLASSITKPPATPSAFDIDAQGTE